MLTLPAAIIQVLSSFSHLFSRPVWQHAQILFTGAVLCSGSRTVAAILRVMGLNDEKRFEKYHRVLNRASWSTLQGGKILLGLLIKLLPESWPILIGIDDTIERRKGKKIKAKGCYRDAVRSSQKKTIKCFGLKWISLMLLVPLPWCKRPWALPFLTILAPSKKANEKSGKRHKTSIDWAMQMVKLVSRWLRRNWIIIGDGGFSCVELARTCVTNESTLISRLRLDARLFEAPAIPQPGKRGRKPKVGKRISLKELAIDEEEVWQKITVNWYDEHSLTVSILTGIALWYTPAQTPIWIRWVLVQHPQKGNQYDAFFSTDITLEARKIVDWFIMRWSVEVTFEESRRHLGIETQRQWSDLAILRTTPILFSLFSIITIIVRQSLTCMKVPLRTSAWYKKEQATFSDILAMARRFIWAEKYLNKCTFKDDQIILNQKEWINIIEQLSAVA